MKLLKKLLAGALCGAMACAALAGCGATEAEATPVDLKLSGMRTEFAYGEAFSSSGLTVTIVYSDNTEQKANARNYTVDSSKYRADTAGDYEITVTCKELKKSYTVTVNEAREPEEQGAPDWYEDGVLKILLIGNSFSEDTAEYVWEICNSLGLTAEIGLLWIGGTNIDQHLEYAQNNTANYEFKFKDTAQSGEWKITGGRTFNAVVTSNDWDFITLQQSGAGNGRPETLGAIDRYLAYVSSLASENARIYWLMTWAFRQSPNSTDTFFEYFGGDQLTMYQKIVETTQEIIVPRGIPVIPSGTAIQNARTSFMGDTLNRDDIHLSLGLGRYISALTLFEKLTGLPLPGELYAPSSVTAAQKEVAIESVQNALEKPFEITESQHK